MEASSRVVLPSHVTPVHYKLDLTPDHETLEFLGVLDVDVVVTSSTAEIILHSREIFIQSASFKPKSSSKSIEISEISYNLKANTVSLKFAESIQEGDGVLALSYRGVLNGDMAGYYKSSYVDADGKKQIMSNTQFEPLDARRAFPCWDEPAVKATFAISLTVPHHLTALSNMPELSVEYLPGGKKKVVFATTPVMSTYLVAWAVGQFDYLQTVTDGGVIIRVYCPPRRSKQGLFALDIGKRCLDFYDSFFNLKYPLPKLDMICCTEFAMGAMENWGLVTYREVDLMIEEAKASPQQKQRVGTIICHELAHQWFGNLVTMQWWDDLWLNEGFASYMQNLATNHLFPEYKLWEQYTVEQLQHALRLDGLRSSHPIQVPIKHAEEVEQVFDAISYAKGSAVVRMVAALLGETAFRDGLRLYMSRHQYKNTVTTDLWAAWSEVSGLDVNSLMASWTQQMGYPFLSVDSEEWTDGYVTVTLTQQWFLADGSVLQGEELQKKWSVPLLFATSGGVSESAVIMTEKTQTFKIPLNGGSAVGQEWLKINAGEHALVRVAHSPSLIQRLQPAIANKVLPPADRAALLIDAYSLAKAGVAPLEQVVALLKAYGNEDSSTVWTAIESVLHGLHLPMETIGGAAFEAFSAFARRTIRNALDKVGWAPQPGAVDGHTDKLLRSSVLSLAETFLWDDEAVLGEARRRFHAHWDAPEELPADFRSIVYRLVLRSGGAEEFEKLLSAFYATEDNTEKKYVLLSLGATSDPRLQTRALDWCVKGLDPRGEVKLQDFFYPIRSVAFVSAQASQLTWEYVKDNLAMIRAKLARASPSLMDAVIITALCRHCTLEQAKEVEDFFAANPIPQSSRKIAQTVEAIRATGGMLEKIRASSLSDPASWA